MLPEYWHLKCVSVCVCSRLSVCSRWSHTAFTVFVTEEVDWCNEAVIRLKLNSSEDRHTSNPPLPHTHTHTRTLSTFLPSPHPHTLLSFFVTFSFLFLVFASTFILFFLLVSISVSCRHFDLSSCLSSFVCTFSFHLLHFSSLLSSSFCFSCSYRRLPPNLSSYICISKNTSRYETPPK